MAHNFKNLLIWQKGMDICAEIDEICSKFPKHELYKLSSQMNGASVSIPSNIAEGSNRGNKHFILFLNNSLGSSYELQTQLLIALRRKYVCNKVEENLIEFQKMTIGFINKLT
jgi:four helix bundle protein